MGHGHHHHVDPEAGDRRVFAAIAVNKEAVKDYKDMLRKRGN